MSSLSIPIAIVHHANQFLITNGYDNRPGIDEIIGPPDASSGLRAVFDLHSQYNIPFHLHISGTFLEACAWFDPLFLEEIVELREAGLVEIIGSTYAQNIMPLFDLEHNRYQVEEELRLFETWLGADISEVTGFWVPERVWNTQKLCHVLTDTSLPNGGFQYVLVDDRLILPDALRGNFDQNPRFIPELFEAHRIEGSRGLIALPLSYDMRLSIPLETEKHGQRLKYLMSQMRQEIMNGRDVIAIYGDDMEKVAGIPPWNPLAVQHYRGFLEWLISRQDVTPVLLQSWLADHKIQPQRPLGTGTYRELATEFGAGEDYMNWANSQAWAPYQRNLIKTWEELKKLASKIAHPSSLLELARKHMLACTYETGWHDAPNSIHSDPDSKGVALPAPWARAVASHVRTTSILMEAVKWEQDFNNSSFVDAFEEDIDNDGHKEVIIRNNTLAAVISPRFGGRIIYLFFYNKNDGQLIIGNPSDDWNWLEELNDFMDVPMNHPGALADYGFEHDSYEVQSLTIKDQQEIELVIVNKQSNSAAFGMTKRFLLKKRQSHIHIKYDHIPSNILPLSLDIGLSPDYLRLLREGRSAILPYQSENKRGFQNGDVISWVSPDSENTIWRVPRNPIFGHGFCLTLMVTSNSSSFNLGVESSS
jgi:Glycosyl hydrolase family 57